MAGDTTTPHLVLTKPEPHASPLDWGIKINTDLDLIDLAIANLDNGSPKSNQILLNKTTVAAGNPVSGALNGKPRWQIQLGGGEAESGANVGSSFSVSRFSDAGAFIDSPLIIARATGGAYFTKPLTVNASIGCQDNVLIIASTTSVNPGLYLNSPSVNKGILFWNQAADQLVLSKASGGSLSIDSANQFYFSGSSNAYKAGGGSWAALSDARIKTVINDYDGGLSEILQLRPVVYRYNGNDGEAHKQVAADHKSFIGLVAQEVEGVMPELVSYGKGEIDGAEVSDLRTLDSTALIYALINSVKELKAEIEELKRR